ncbi:hypothetical protein GCM10027019_28570 [Melaminivora jejuensis]|uniref:FliH/SctL family protein n=1 Tax=Melaminivora jejuensis TaxID=1267217 RepID=UPI001AE0D349|nr:flagellar assembly protein FliH [Melaminivora jejuensis]UHJ64614.1 flagellar assembly protein FliH [Melaminivora jejuensis]
MASGKQRHYTRFVPREEVGEVTRWRFGAIDGEQHGFVPLGSVVAEPPPEPEVEDEVVDLPPEPVQEGLPLDEHEALVQQALEQGHAQGLAEGQERERLLWQQRLDEHIAGPGREAAERLAQLAQAFEGSLAGLQQSMAQDVLQLACDIARQVVRSELSVNRRAVLPVVREALAMLGSESRPAIVRLNPADWQAVHETLQAEHPSMRIEWLQDAGVQPGECVVESAGTVIEGTLDQRWRRAIAALGLTDLWREAGDEH